MALLSCGLVWTDSRSTSGKSLVIRFYVEPYQGLIIGLSAAHTQTYYDSIRLSFCTGATRPTQEPTICSMVNDFFIRAIPSSPQYSSLTSTVSVHSNLFYILLTTCASG